MKTPPPQEDVCWSKLLFTNLKWSTWFTIFILLSNFLKSKPLKLNQTDLKWNLFHKSSCFGVNICRCVDDKPFPPKYQVSQAKAEALGVEFLPFEQSIKDTIESLREKNFVDSSISFWASLWLFNLHSVINGKKCSLLLMITLYEYMFA